jgi:histidyl-tRNA synthetase
LTLKPEGTAGAARAFVENSLYGNAQPTKVYYVTSCFRNERPQAGRYKEFHQFGVEVYGTYSAYADAELISLVYEILNRLGVKNIRLKLNSLGGNECRVKYNDVLKKYIGENINEMCSDCRERFEKNPLRVLDCKNEHCQQIIGDAPEILDVLGDECKAHFEALKSSLTAMGIPFEVDPKIVRGLDYYTKTVFEFVSDDIGSQGTICGGGRYDNLVKECGGPSIGAVGFAMGIERIMMVLRNQGIAEAEEKKPLIYIGSIGEKGAVKAQEIGYVLRKNNIPAEYDVVGRSVKAQMKYADKIGALYNVVLGDDEIANDSVRLKNMENGEQEEIKVSEIVEVMKNKK